MTDYKIIVKTYDQGEIVLGKVLNLKLKRGTLLKVFPDRPEMGSGSTKLTASLDQDSADRLSRVCRSSDHFGDFHIYRDDVIIGVIESCSLGELEIQKSLITDKIITTFRMSIGGSREVTRAERIAAGINRLKGKV